MPNTCKISPKWRHFHKSGHTSHSQNAKISIFRNWILCEISFQQLNNSSCRKIVSNREPMMTFKFTTYPQCRYRLFNLKMTLFEHIKVTKLKDTFVENFCNSLPTIWFESQTLQSMRYFANYTANHG